METTIELFKDLAIIILAAKVCGIFAAKLKAPQVVGEIIAGLLIGPSILGLVEQSDILAAMAEIGVVLLMFGAGLETNLKELLTQISGCMKNMTTILQWQYIGFKTF